MLPERVSSRRGALPAGVENGEGRREEKEGGTSFG